MRYYRLLVGPLVFIASCGLVLMTYISPNRGLVQQTADAQTMDMPCGLHAPAFCDTFDQPFTGGGRTGQLDPSRWTVGRFTGVNNSGQGLYNAFKPSEAMHCKTPISGVVPDNDYFMCGPEAGESMHFMEAFDDAGSYVYNDARIRQPFDFANRTGTVTFDVDAKTSGGHGWWTEIWITDDPIQGPHDNTFVTLPRNGLGLDFSSTCGTEVPAGDAGAPKGSLNGSVVVRDYQVVGPFPNKPGPTLEYDGCYTTMPDMQNHFRILINQQHLEVWATDAGATEFRLVAKMDGLNLGFTRGFVHLEHVAYNAEKAAEPKVVSHAVTYHWDNVGFDGPVLPVPALYSIPDSLSVGPFGFVNTGYSLTADGIWNNGSNPDPRANSPGPLTFTNVNPSGATSAILSMTIYGGTTKYRFNNGAWHTWTPPVGDNGNNAIIPVDPRELRAGTNIVDFSNDQNAIIANIDLIMAGANAITPLPTGTSQPSSTPIPSRTPTRTSTAITSTPVPTMTCELFVVRNGDVFRRSNISPEFCT